MRRFIVILDLGACCACGREGDDVRNLIMLDYESPTPGNGWGCFQCNLPMNGATAVVCDGCMKGNASIRFVIDGMPANKQRVDVDAFEKVPFVHNLALHPEIFPANNPMAGLVWFDDPGYSERICSWCGTSFDDDHDVPICFFDTETDCSAQLHGRCFEIWWQRC